MKVNLKILTTVLITSILLILFQSCAVKSVVSISPNKTFVLGEQQNSRFEAIARNISNQTVELLLVDKSTNSTKKIIELAPNQTAKVKALANEKILIENTNNDLVRIKVIMNKGVEGMRYQSIVLEEESKLLKDSLIKELFILEQALTEMHPGLYRYNTPNQIKDIFNNLRNSLPQSISEADYMIHLAQTASKIKCGHTYLNPWNMNPELRKRLFTGQKYLPLGFTIIDGKFYVTEIATEQIKLQRGAEILKINGIPTSHIYKSLRTVAKQDGNNEASIDHYFSLWDYQPNNWHAFDLYFQLFYPLQNDTFQIEFQNHKSTKINQIELPALSKETRAEKMSVRYGAEILEKNDWSMQIISKDLAVMSLGTFAIWNFKNFDHKIWFANAFKKLDSLKINRLAIDIRGNGGGLAAPANELISYLITTPLPCNDLGKVYIKTTQFPKELLPHIKSGVEILKIGLPTEIYREASDGLYELMLPSDCEDIYPKSNRFKGDVFLFGGPSNVSATYTLLDKANRFGFATFIGDESGGNLKGINGGEYAFFTLPYSRMEIDIPLKYFAPNTSRPDSGALPKVLVKYTQKDIAENVDPFFEFLNQ